MAVSEEEFVPWESRLLFFWGGGAPSCDSIAAKCTAHRRQSMRVKRVEGPAAKGDSSISTFLLLFVHIKMNAVDWRRICPLAMARRPSSLHRCRHHVIDRRHRRRKRDQSTHSLRVPLHPSISTACSSGGVYTRRLLRIPARIDAVNQYVPRRDGSEMSTHLTSSIKSFLRASLLRVVHLCNLA